MTLFKRLLQPFTITDEPQILRVYTDKKDEHAAYAVGVVGDRDNPAFSLILYGPSFSHVKISQDQARLMLNYTGENVIYKIKKW